MTISDRGIGMTAEELDKYINQIALSSANEFLEKYKDSANAIIGHFGLGFIQPLWFPKSRIITKSYKEDAPAVKWSCEGTPDYKIEEAQKPIEEQILFYTLTTSTKNFWKKKKLNRC